MIFKNIFDSLFSKKNLFKPLNTLEEYLISGTKDVLKRPEFYKELMNSYIYLLGKFNNEHNGSGFYIAKEGGKVEIRLLEVQGIMMVPIFSSLQRVREFIKEGEKYSFIGFKELVENVTDVDVIMNPSSQYGKIFTVDEIKSILSGNYYSHKSVDFNEETKIMLGHPSKYPQKLIDSLVTYFKSNKKVISSYLAHIYIPSSNEPPHNIIGIEINEHYEKASREVGLISQSILDEGEFIDVIKIGDCVISEYMLKETKPFYIKGQ